MSLSNCKRLWKLLGFPKRTAYGFFDGSLAMRTSLAAWFRRYWH